MPKTLRNLANAMHVRPALIISTSQRIYLVAYLAPAVCIRASRQFCLALGLPVPVPGQPRLLL